MISRKERYAVIRKRAESLINLILRLKHNAHDFAVIGKKMNLAEYEAGIKETLDSLLHNCRELERILENE